MEENEEVNNEIQIAEEVVSVIVAEAIKDVEGVAKVATGFAGGLSEAFGKKSLGKGSRVEINGKEIKIDVGIVVKYGVKIPEVAEKMQKKIIVDVEKMTGYKVTGVNIKVQGIVNSDESTEED